MEKTPLNLIAIRKMIEKNNQLNMTIPLINKALEALDKGLRMEGIADFLNGLNISPETLKHYQNNKRVMYHLCLYGALPRAEIQGLALQNCEFAEIRELGEAGHIDNITALEDRVISFKRPDYNLIAAFYIKGVNVTKLETATIALEADAVKTGEGSLEYQRFFKTLQDFFIQNPDPTNKMNIAQIFCKYNARQYIIDIVDKFIKANEPRLKEALQANEAIHLLYEYYITSRKGNLPGELHNYKQNLVNRIINGRESDVALCIKMFHLYDSLNDILNGWALNDGVLPFNIYLEYLLGGATDYELTGKSLDAKYQEELKKMAHEPNNAQVM